MKILLTGASSYVGARLYFDLSKKFEVIGTFNGSNLSEKFIHLDVTDREEVRKVIKEVKPDVIIHAAANADARWCEANPEKAIALNQESTKYSVESANEINAKVILLSSFAAFNSVNVYSNTKIESEKYVKETKNGYIILRPSLIVGFSPNMVNDRPFNRFLKNIDQKTEAVYDTSWKFQPTYIRHVSEVIAQVLEKNITNVTIPIAVEKLVNRFELSTDILMPFGIKVEPIDKQDTTPVAVDNLEKLKELKLPEYTYEEMIKNITDEIKNREQYLNI